MDDARLATAGDRWSVPGAAQPFDPNLAQSGKQPISHDHVADKPSQSRTVIVQSGSVQRRPGMGKSSLLRKREGHQQSHWLAGHIALAIALEQNERSLRQVYGQGGQRRKQQQFWIGGPEAQSLLGNLAHLR
ncbi:MAG TPA: hypothetical protein VHT74_18925 [Acetobacteraceae bacterium]|nr:hypothetical protein [Acetobacteraceae bacterium]